MIPVRAWIAIALVVGIAALIGWSRWQVNSLRADLAEARATATACTAALDTQSAAVKSWKLEADARAARAAEALAKAATQRRRADSLAATLYDMQLPTGECDALVTLVDTARSGGL